MAYNNAFPVTYQPTPYYPQNMVGTQMPMPQMSYANNATPTNGLIWVIGEAAAKSYHVNPNTTVALWDSESQIVYLKSADASGMPSMKILDYTIRDYAPQVQQASQVVATQEEFVTRDEFSDFETRIMKQLERYNNRDNKDNGKRGEQK